MKKEIRIVGFDDSPFDKFKDGDTLVIGAFYRGGSFMDGVVSTKVKVDGEDSTEKLISSVKKSKFYPQLQAILLDGIAFGGFNIIDIKELSKRTRLPVIVVIRHVPDFKKIISTLRKIGFKEKIKLIDKAGQVYKVGDVYCQYKGCKKEFVEKLLRITCTHSHIPEAIRVAHLIAAGVKKGESKGRA
ncbi:DUF99 family protein [Candidatus Woesearchaeota archaeon]|nr:DUF99 family protein [Candidatus Woesearchaeota archaeon]